MAGAARHPRHPPQVCVTEVPLLYESGGETRFDRVVVITAPRKLREQRRQVPLDNRDDRLIDDAEKVARADFHYVNTGTFEDLDAWVEGLMKELAGHDGDPERHLVRRLLIALTGVAVLGAIAFAVAQHQPDFVQRIRYPLRYEAIVRGHARNYDLDPALLAAVIYTESRFNARAHSDAGAMGLMQLLPDTARGIALRTGGHKFVVDDLYSPEINVRYGAWYLRNLLDRYGDERTALAAYHAGPGNVDSWREQGVGIQFPETRSYVAKVEEVKKIYAGSYAKELGLR